MIRQRGLARGDFMDYRGRVCSLGALFLSAGYSIRPEYELLKGDPAYRNAVRALAHATKKAPAVVIDNENIVVWFSDSATLPQVESWFEDTITDLISAQDIPAIVGRELASV